MAMAASKKATKATKKRAARASTKTAAAPKKTAAAKPAAAKAAAAKASAAKASAAKASAAKAAAAKASAASKSAATRKSAQGNGRSAASRASFVDGLAKRLDEHRREILHLYRHDLGVGLDAFRDGDDEIDRANFDSDRDLALSLSDSEREVLLQIEEALRRIDRGEFGSCTSCTKAIGEQRLHAIPWARYCIDCQELEEKGLLG